ncbi:MAG: hypothetical protein R3E95_00515 [Thiolinea sp.]
METTAFCSSTHILRQLMGFKNKTTIKDASELTNYGKRLQLRREFQSDEAFAGGGVLRHRTLVESPQRHELVKKFCRKAVRWRDSEDSSHLHPPFSNRYSSGWRRQPCRGSRRELLVMVCTLPAQVENIKTTVDNLLAEEGWSNFHYSSQHEELAMQHPDHGIFKRLSLLAMFAP